MESTKDKETLSGKEDDEPSRDDIPGTTQAPSNGGKPINASIRDTVTTALLEDCETEGDENPRPKHSEDVASDPELDELLDLSLSEFGKHVPKEKPTASLPTTTSPKDRPLDSDLPTPPEGMEDLEDMFSEEFVAQAEAQLDEAMKMLSSQNPALWQQFQTFAKSMGLEEGAQFPPPFASQGESSVDKTEGQEGEGGARGDSAAATGSSLDAKLEETLKKLRESTQKIESGGVPADLSDMLGGIDLNSEEGEEGLMHAMQGMMNTLLSKEVLYPSLKDLCEQYPKWLDSHRDKLPPEEVTRYSKQLDIMISVCKEFEKEGKEEGERERQARSQRILELMQQLQQYGQPPEDLASDSDAAGFPSVLSNLEGAQNCSVM